MEFTSFYLAQLRGAISFLMLFKFRFNIVYACSFPPSLLPSPLLDWTNGHLALGMDFPGSLDLASSSYWSVTASKKMQQQQLSLSVDQLTTTTCRAGRHLEEDQARSGATSSSCPLLLHREFFGKEHFWVFSGVGAAVRQTATT